MERTLNMLIISLIAAAGLQIATVHFLTRSASYSELVNMDTAGLHTAYSLMPLLF